MDYEKLMIAIVGNAVDDYMLGAKRIQNLYENKQKIMIKIVQNGLKLKKPKFITYEQAEELWQDRVKVQKGLMDASEEFLSGSWCATICCMDGKIILKKAKQKLLKQYGINCDLL